MEDIAASVESKGIANLIREVLDRKLVPNGEKEMLNICAGRNGRGPHQSLDICFNIVAVPMHYQYHLQFYLNKL